MNAFMGTGVLVRLALRRDRVLLPVWILIFVASTVSSAQATIALYPSETSIVAATKTINEAPVMLALYGRIYDESSIGALSLFKMSTLGVVFLGILAVMLVTRHTRAEEEAGRSELLGSTVLGRWASLSAALVVVCATMLTIGVLCAVGLQAADLPAAGSWAFGLAWAGSGVCFAALAAVCAQMTTSARAAKMLGSAGLAVAFVLRAVGDVTGTEGGPSLWSWLSPIGWGQQVRPFAGDRWWPLAGQVVIATAVVSGAFAIAARRDLGAGVLADRRGPQSAVGWLRSPLALAWRLQRGPLAGWLLGYVSMGCLVGLIVSDVGSMVESPEARDLIARMGGTSVFTDAYLAMMCVFAGFTTASYGISAALRLHGEEVQGRAEPVLATGVSRMSLLWSHLAVALTGTTLLSAVLGAVMGLVDSLDGGAFDGAASVAGAVMVYLPAIWVVTAVAVALVGAAPRLAGLAWAVIVGIVVLTEFGALLRWPRWVLDASPFAHVSQLPAQPLRWMPMLVLLGLAAVMVAVGSMTFARRDLDTP